MEITRKSLKFSPYFQSSTDRHSCANSWAVSIPLCLRYTSHWLAIRMTRSFLVTLTAIYSVCVHSRRIYNPLYKSPQCIICVIKIPGLEETGGHLREGIYNWKCNSAICWILQRKIGKSYRVKLINSKCIIFPQQFFRPLVRHSSSATLIIIKSFVWWIYFSGYGYWRSFP